MSAVIQDAGRDFMRPPPPSMPPPPPPQSPAALVAPPGLAPPPGLVRPPPGLEHLAPSLSPWSDDLKPSCGDNTEDFYTSEGSTCSAGDTPETISEATMTAPPTPPDSSPRASQSNGCLFGFDDVYSPGKMLRQEASAVAVKQELPQVINLSDFFATGEDQGVLGVPSVGSAGHYVGMCQPCDFVHRGSCRTGVACKFCHLCGPEENKRRKKEKRKVVRAMVSLSQQWNQRQCSMPCGGCVPAACRRA